MKAFTLTELLVVMVVILILLSLCIPLYRHAADFQFDVMPEALRCTHAMRSPNRYSVMLVRRDEIGTFAICMEASGIPLTASIDLDTKRIQVPDYDPAVVIYDPRGQLCTGMKVLVDGTVYAGTNRLVLDGETKWLHRSQGEMITGD